MTLKLVEHPAKNGWGTDDGEYVCHFYGDGTVTLDGIFTPEELRQLADRMEAEDGHPD